MARRFEFTTDIQYLSSASVPISGVPATLAGWIKITEGSDGVVMAVADNTTNRSKIWVGISGLVVASAGAQDDDSFGLECRVDGGAVSISAGNWYHLCGTFFFSTPNVFVELFVNGVTDGNASSSDNQNTYVFNRTSIGAVLNVTPFGYPQSSDTDADVAESAIWNRVLSNQEIAALGKGFSPTWFPKGLVAYQDLIRNLNRPGVGPVLADNGPGGTTSVVTHQPKIIYPFRRRFTGIHDKILSLRPSATRLAGGWSITGA